MNEKAIGQDITPDTIVATLLKEYPELESTLIELSPAFAKLRNPVLRKTVAKIANLRQAAEIGKIPLGKMINTLRCAAGLEATDTPEPETETDVKGKPDWVEKMTIIKTFDARSMIESGGHPLTKVMEDLGQLGDDESYCLVTPFLPAPLLDVARNRGYYTWTEQQAEDRFCTHFARELQ